MLLQCGKKISIRQDSWFAKSLLSLPQIITLTYYWVYRYPAEIVQHELKLGCNHTTTDWFNFAREVCSEILENNGEKIGGPGKTVETNLSLLKGDTTERKGSKEFGCLGV